MVSALLPKSVINMELLLHNVRISYPIPQLRWPTDEITYHTFNFLQCSLMKMEDSCITL